MWEYSAKTRSHLYYGMGLHDASDTSDRSHRSDRSDYAAEGERVCATVADAPELSEFTYTTNQARGQN